MTRTFLDSGIMTRALLALEDGTLFYGQSAGSKTTTFGEVVFNTSMTGYQEVLTDPSYCGQIVVMTYPHQGNYGIADIDGESARPWVRGFVAKTITARGSSWRSEKSLDEYLLDHDIASITDIDTRALVRHIRSHGAMKGGITTDVDDPQSFVDRVKAAPSLEETDLVAEVTTKAPYDADASALLTSAALDVPPAIDAAQGMKIAALDFGMKTNILRQLVGAGFAVRVFPATATRDQILDYSPDGIFLSNGPGDPSTVGYGVQTVKDLLASSVPIFGICLGHQLLSLAMGLDTYKLPFGHRGANHPVKNLATSKVEITTQNHGFCVRTNAPFGEVFATDCGSAQATHVNLNDQTLEGIKCLDVNAFAVQYHPEAAPGPHDSRYLFQQFVDLTGQQYANR